MTANASHSSSKFLHPATGALILGLDWLLFSGNMATLGLSTVASVGAGFILGGIGTGWIQHRYGGDAPGTSIAKGILGGLTVGVPLPVAGTAVGGAVLALSGLNQLWGSSSQPSDDRKSLDR